MAHPGIINFYLYNETGVQILETGDRETGVQTLHSGKNGFRTHFSKSRAQIIHYYSILALKLTS